MKFILSLLLTLFIAASSAQVIKNNQIIIGNTDNVSSKILNEKRKIWVYVPPAGDDTIYAKNRYPVVYVLDGDAHFAGLTAMTRHLAQTDNALCPKMIVVGIPNTNRTRDLTPTNSIIGPDGKRMEWLKASGGGEKFVAFMEKELIPHIDSLYPTAPYKILIGHSFGGLTVMNILVNHKEMFNAYVAIDPSMWWDSRRLLNQAKEVLKQQNYKGQSLYLAIANTMADGMDTMKVRKDTSSENGHIRSILDLADILKNTTKTDGLNFAYRYYTDDDHPSVPFIAEYDAIRFLFRFYAFPKSDVIALSDVKSKTDPVQLIQKQYDKLSAVMGYKVLPPGETLNTLGYYYLQNGAPGKAFSVFNLNIQNYPQSFNVYDTMGDYYSTQNNKAQTIVYYNKALKLHENPETREKLNKLLVKK